MTVLTNPAAADDPSLWSQIQQGGVLGMPVNEALLRFGSGLLSGNDWNEGLSRAGASLVQGSSQARAFQAQQLRAQQQFQQQRQLQDERIAAQERIAAANRSASGAFGTDRALAGERLVDPETGTLYHFDRNRVFRLGASEPIPENDPVLGRLQRAPQMVTTGNQEGQRLAQRRIDEIFSEASNATGTIRDVETALAVLRDPETGQPRIATGQSIPAQVVRGVSRYLGINVNGTTPERLDVLQAYLGNLSAEQRADLLRGLQPISNAEFQSANQALATMATDPNALVTLLEIQKSAARRQVELAAALRQENVTDLVSRGAVRAWEFDWRRRALEQNSGPRVEDTGNQQPPRLAPASVRRNDDGTIVYIPPGQRGQQDPPPPPPPPAPAPTTSPQPQPAEPPPGVNPEVWRRFQGLGLPPR